MQFSDEDILAVLALVQEYGLKSHLLRLAGCIRLVSNGGTKAVAVREIAKALSTAI